MRVFPAALGRYRGHGPFKNFQQRLLHAFTADIPGNGNVFGLFGNLINFINVNNPPRGGLHIEIGGLEQFQQNIFHIFPHVTGFRQGCGIGHGKGHVKKPGKSLSEERFPGSGGAHQEDIGFL